MSERISRIFSASRNSVKEVWCKLRRTKEIGSVSDMLDTQLHRCLSTLDITLLGIGHMVGSGVYVLTAPIAKKTAGPAIVIAYLISGLASLLAALCYSEFSVRFPRAGSAYSYSYLALGEFWAFTVGWNMVMENLIGIAAVSRAFSSYIDSLVDGSIKKYIGTHVASALGLSSLSDNIDVLAFFIVIVFVFFLTCGVRVTSYLNNLFSLVNIGVILIIISVGAYFSDTANWRLPDGSYGKGGFMPYGWSGVFAASASCFYAYIGFDSIATSGEEAKDPQHSIPLATFISMGFATLAYVGVSAVLTLMIPFYEIDESGLPDALGSNGAVWAKYLVVSGACCGMVTVLIGTMYALTRIVYAMADDGLLFAWMGVVNEKTQIPLLAMYFFTSIGAILALLIDITTLIEMMSIGTLLAYLVVSTSVIIVRYEPSEPMHQSLSTDFDNQQELNELSAESPTRENGDQLISASVYDNRKESDYSDDSSLSFSRRVKRYFCKLRYRNTSDTFLTTTIALMVLFIFILCWFGPMLIKASKTNSSLNVITGLLAVIIAICFTLIALQEQNTSALRYKVPFVPFVPTMSIVINVALMTNLNVLTWIRLIVWMILGFAIYFGYGIKHSVLNPEAFKMKKDVKNWGSLDDHNYLTGETASIASAY
ncbi:cationic amino acid transporter 4-like protein [Leptotrombidium deliense]|uniref:Cationic amino acid transporter 4-like protein n=1 Tax=Leptotrombidium deliense TaxID=299467 RepID=A0A443SWK6_9ACAR|nr:cationic amino acid transporter 4-like protein [Leptotrombidium deliense]